MRHQEAAYATALIICLPDVLLLCKKKGRDYVRGTLQSCSVCLFILSPGMSSINLDKARVKYKMHLEFLKWLEL